MFRPQFNNRFYARLKKFIPSLPGVQSFTATPSGGIVFDGAGTINRGINFIPAAGIIFAGTGASNVGVAIPSPTGGLVFDGNNIAAVGVQFTPAGGIIFDGSATPVRGSTPTPDTSVPLVFAGTGNASSSGGNQSLTVTPDGGIIFAGGATPVAGVVETPNGGIIFGGSGSVFFGPAAGPTTYRKIRRHMRTRMQ